MLKSIALPAGNLAVYDQGAGLPVVFVHGFPLDHRMWQAQVAPLAAHYRVLAPDLRGFGASSTATGAESMAEMADDLAQMLDELDVREPVVLCGLSMGGYVAWQFFRRHRALLRGLVLCDTRAAADSAEAFQARGALAARVLAEGSAVLAPAMLDRLIGPETQRGQPGLVSALAAHMNAASPAGVAAALGAMARRPDASSWLPTIDVPTLVVVGADDVISPAPEMQKLAESIPGARLLVVPGAGHLSPWEQPAVVNAALLGFLANL